MYGGWDHFIVVLHAWAPNPNPDPDPDPGPDPDPDPDLNPNPDPNPNLNPNLKPIELERCVEGRDRGGLGTRY